MIGGGDASKMSAAVAHGSSMGDRMLTRQLADKPTRSQSSRGLDNSRTGQLAYNELLYFICTLNLTLALTLTLSNIGSK